MRKTSYFALRGGLNLVDPALSKGNGEVLTSKNYEPYLHGGYKQSSGYERFDGQTRPSKTTVTINSVLYDTDSYHYLDTADKTTFDTQREANRTLISTVPGSGSVLGVVIYADNVYAFRNNSGGTAAVMHKATSSGWTVVTTATLSPGGKYEFDIYNFGTGAKLYGCDGVNKVFQYDGTTFTQLTTGLTTDTPSHLRGHKEHLFVSFESQLFNSALGDPTDWTAANGAVEYNVKETIVGLAHVVGDLLTVFSKNQTKLLYGVSASTFELKTHSESSGAFEWTIATETTPLFFGEQGITNLQATQAYGDFQASSFTRKIKPALDPYKVDGTVAGAANDLDRNLYRLYFTDGKSLNLLFDGRKAGDALFSDYGLGYNVITQGQLSGENIILAGCDDGYIYQMEVGESSDGADIESIIKLSYSHFKTPERKKRFFQFSLEVEVPGEVSINYAPDYSYGSTDKPQENSNSVTVEAGGGQWTFTEWDSFLWSNQSVGEAFAKLSGSGTNISMIFNSTTKNTIPYVLQGIIYHYSVRGIKR